MPIVFECSKCSSTVRVPDKSGGKKCKCPNCQTVLVIPTSEPSIPNAGLSEASDKLHVPCPRCQNILICDASLAGTRGMCKNCKHIFTIAPPGQQEDVTSEVPQSFPFQCPECKQLFEGQPGMEGRNGKCTNCKAIFVIKRHVVTAPALPTPTAPRPAPSAPLKPAKPQPTPPTPAQDNRPRATPSNSVSTPRPASIPVVKATPVQDTRHLHPFDSNELWAGVAAATNTNQQTYTNPYQSTASRSSSRGSYVPDLNGSPDSIRNYYLAHESAIRSVGLLYTVLFGFYIVIGVLMLLGGVYLYNVPNVDPKFAATFLGMSCGIIAFASLGYFVGTGLSKINEVGRIGGIIIAILSLCGIPLGTLWAIYLLYLFLSEKGRVVFSRKYKSVVQQTPHIYAYTTTLVLVLLVLFVVMIVLSIIANVISLLVRLR